MNYSIDIHINKNQQGICNEDYHPEVNIVDDFDEKCMALIKEGDESAFEIIFRKYHPQLLNYCRKMVGDNDSAKEIVHSVFVNIWNNKEKMDSRCALKAYLYKSVKNRSISYMKSRARFIEHEDFIEEEIRSSVSDPYEELNKKELAEAYSTAVGKLPEKCRNVLLLVKESGLSYREASEILDVSTKTVETQMRIAFQKLRKTLSRYLDRN